MKVSIKFECNSYDDGFDGETSASREGVEDLYAMAQFLTDAVKGAGYTYVTDVGFEKDDGSMVFGEI